jgi:hypothetical protein
MTAVCNSVSVFKALVRLVTLVAAVAIAETFVAVTRSSVSTGTQNQWQ